jgi:CheY-like chemotaxis protein
VRILIVDDEDDARETLAEFFEDEGCQVSTAANGAEALARLAEEELPSVVILDLLMPVLDGNQVYERMQRDPRLAKVPVIVSTSAPARAPSGVLIMRKPMNLHRLMNVVQKCCAQPPAGA